MSSYNLIYTLYLDIYLCSTLYKNQFIQIQMKVKKISGYNIFLDQRLGKGAYGTVYKGQKDGANHSKVAIKVIDKSNIDADPYLKAALVSQIKIMQSVKSPNIVQLLDVMESGRNYYIIQELCDIDLQKYLKEQPHKVLSQKQAIRVLTQICSGFLALVKQGILHRDLKPANVFLANKKVKVGDFGFAKKNQGGLRNQTAVGTPLYMSLQLLKSEPYTSKCDVWALGFIFYEMLHGKTPWVAKSEYELVKNIQNKPLIIDEKLGPNTKLFLKQTLSTTQDKRLSWQEVYAHPIFQGAFQKEIDNHLTLENKFKKILTDIRIQVNLQNINLKKVWRHLGYQQTKNLSEQQFKKFIECIVPQIEKNELQFFFLKMDVNKDGTVSLKQLQQKFKQHQIPLSSAIEDRIPYLLKKTSTMTEQQNHSAVDQQLQAKIKSAFRKLQNTLTKRKMSLNKVYKAYDIDGSGKLNLDQFGRIMTKLDSSLTNQQILVLFQLIDIDKSKTIELPQFNSYYCKIVGIPQSAHEISGQK